MNPVKKRRRLPQYGVQPFPLDEKAQGIFTGLDIEIFDPQSILILTDSGCYGFHSKPRQTIAYYDKQPIVKVSQNEYHRKLEWKEKFGGDDNGKLVSVGEEEDEQLLPDPFDIPKSIILFPEEAFFLVHQQKCLEVQDLDGNDVTGEQLWKFYYEAKFDFVECYVAYLYLKSKNWVIKAGTKFGGNFCNISSYNFKLKALIFFISSTLQAQSPILPRHVCGASREGSARLLRASIVGTNF